MKCVIPGVHLKVFGKALYSLSRIGDELWFDPLEKGLAMRAVNSSRSAYACIFFSSFFFHSYHRVSTGDQGRGDVPLQLNCKFVSKAVLSVFRCLSTLDRNVETCHINANFSTCHMVFQLFCKHGLTKTHNLAYEDCEPVEAVISKTLGSNVLKIQSRILCDMIIHFPTCQEEVTLTATPQKITLKSYSDEGFIKVMHTEVHLNPNEFHYFQIQTDTEVTFCLREVRGFMSFAETSSTVISVHFSQPGQDDKFKVLPIIVGQITNLSDTNICKAMRKRQMCTQPIVFSIDDITFDGVLVLATLADVDDNMSTQKSKGTAIKSPSSLKKCRRGLVMDKNKEESIPIGHAGNQQPLTTCNPTVMANQHETEKEASHALSFNTFCNLFFGAISPGPKEKSDQPGNCLATASDDEDDCYQKELSQTF
ncbi:cell cycle checkpoint control protein RAD9B [Gastrophryne carolinensis]